MAERTEDWLGQFFTAGGADIKDTAIFAPTLPIPYAMQWEYLNRLAEDHLSNISGLAMYSTDIIPDLASHPELTNLPRLSLDPPSTPHAILRQISLGADMFALPFINATSDAGVALTFTFPPADSSSELLPLGEDLSDEKYTTLVQPFSEGCKCYTCTSHHAAYIHHLLSAREMLGWTLLQIHNHFTLSQFFTSVRTSLAQGTFEQDSVAFQTRYEASIPAGTGERPRARGYHFKSEGGQGSEGKKRNRKGWEKLGGDEEGEEKAKVLEINGDLEKIRLEKDLTETPAVPDEIDGGAKELAEHGLGGSEEGLKQEVEMK
jgi:queuine tRNA-ribosyltransferase